MDIDSIRFPLEGNVMIGRSSEATLVYPDHASGISRRHCLLSVKNGELYLTDLGSSYGTFCNGIKLQANVPVRLYVGDEISLGESEECFRIEVSHKAGA